MAETAPAATAAPFAVRDCALITIATGVRAANLKEFREGVARVPSGCLYHHLWGRLLRPQFDEPEYNNDFASWAWRGIHHKPLAERLSMVIPTDFEDLAGVRQEILEILDQQFGESEVFRWSAADRQFHFLQGQMVIFSTGQTFSHPADMVPYLPSFSTGSIFYHFIDARRRTSGHIDDFSAWLLGLGKEFEGLSHQLSRIDPYFSSLKEIRHILTGLFQQFFEQGE